MEILLDGDFLGENPILELSDFTVIPKRKSHAYYEDSMQVLSLLGQNVTSGLSEDEAVMNTIKDMTANYEQQQVEYNELFGDDFTDFGNFNV